MLLRRALTTALGTALALAIFLIAGTLASAPASAHAGHSHAASAGPAPGPVPIVAGGEVALETANADAAGESRGPDLPTSAPCHGSCCTLGGSASCCGPAQVSATGTLGDVGRRSPSPPLLADRLRDGLAPDSPLKPPKSFT